VLTGDECPHATDLDYKLINQMFVHRFINARVDRDSNGLGSAESLSHLSTSFDHSDTCSESREAD
jgi:hypothetical protein